ncbi:lysoplasmalogenase [Lacinutrix sp. Bg11-31]|uniref:lysoplasmalogenase n=1 Tax=Lacinutrix sp. Bg11-31 TaxID=2057808 RepID=UPI000C30DD53|nr:lysoplasmalogenase [Lacinutrix sp. Bg11-31]AUC81003.1 hypothetical protein CW733_02180 [Lacinutrix sp. Bg11-31]
MKFIFKNTFRFSILYIILYFLDALFKNNDALYSYRYISKILLGLSLLLFYLYNTYQKDFNKKRLVIAALSLFVIGNFFFITGDNGNILHFVIAALLFVIAKICYSVRFLNNEVFIINKLIPFLLFCFTYMSIIIFMVYSNLEGFFVPLLIYLFVSMLLMQFAYLRKREVNTISFWLVIIGVVSFMLADSINILKMFYNPLIAYNKITVMFFYCLAQYLIVLGILKETNNNNNKENLDRKNKLN